MRSAELIKQTPATNPAAAASDFAKLLPEKPAVVTPAISSGLVAGIDLENYLNDLQDLAHLVYRYVDLQERTEAEDELELHPLLQRITSNLKHLAVVYTDCLSEAYDQFQKTQRAGQSELDQFPQEIARLQRQLLKTDQQIRQLTESVAILAAAIERQIAFDPTLKNDAQRKARRSELMESDGDYIATTNALKAAQDRREMLLIELQLLRNQFSVLKLNLREAIASKELAAFDAA